MREPASAADELVDRVAMLLAERPEVEAVALGGSRAASTADPGSDIDLYAYTRGDVPLTERRAVVAGAGGSTRANIGLSFFGASDEWLDAATGIEVDVMYFDAAWMEAQLRRVVHEHQASLGYTTCFWRTVRRSRPLFDRNGWFGALQVQARAEYPEALRQNVVALNHPVLRNTMFSYLRQVEKAVRRGDRVSVNHRVTALLASYFDVLFAVNRVLHPGEKRLVASALAECPVLPAEMPADVNAVLRWAASDHDNLAATMVMLLDRLDTLLEREGLDTRLWT